MSGRCIDCGCKTAGKGVRCKKCANTFKNKSVEHRLKNSKAHKGKNNHFYGKKHMPETLEKISGKNCVHYIDGRTENFNFWRESILNRDNHTCQVCGKTKEEIRIDCHHIKSKKDFPELAFDIRNGIALCVKCHQKYENKPLALANKIGELYVR